MRREIVSLRRLTYAVVDFRGTDTSYILDERCNTLWATEQNETLIDEVGCEVVGKTVCRKREVLPSPLQGSPESVEPEHDRSYRSALRSSQ